MKPRRAREEPPGVSLFPFLAVLLCTMGALIVVLVVITRQAQRSAAATSVEVSQAQADSQADAELLALEQSQLRQQIDATRRDLAAGRLRLAQIEDHERTLRRQWQEAVAAADDLLRTSEGEPELASLEHQRELLAARRAAAEAALANAPTQPGHTSYAIVPYEGASGTTRRPVYIECRPDRVVLQPEGIEFRESDFEGSLGPGNALAATVRAAREYLQNQPGSDPSIEPYPLLIVRGSGIRAYYAARAALANWDSEFGYELVDDDWDLTFPEPDPQLAQLAAEAADDARQREAFLARSAPRTRAKAPKPKFRASPTGHGIVRVDDENQGVRVVRRGGGYRERPVEPSGPLPYAAAAESAGGGSGSGEGFADGISDSALARGSAAGGPLGDEALAGAPSSTDPLGNDGESGGNESTDTHSNNPGGEAGGDSLLGSASADSQVDESSGIALGAPGARAVDAIANAEAAGSTLSGDGAALGAARNAASGTSSAASTTGGSSATPPSPTNASSASAGTAGNAGSTADPSAMNQISLGNPPSSQASLADTRGQDWGLPEREHQAWPIARDVRLRLFADRAEILPSPGERNRAQRVDLTGPTRAHVDELVSALWVHMKGWGIAGHGMYWKPRLHVEVMSTAESRYADLAALLADSGLDVVRKTTSPLPAVPPGPRNVRRSLR